MKEKVFEFFGCTVKIERTSGPNWACAPWRFSVAHNGVVREFVGIPNYCFTFRQALMRAWWRAKWLSDGTFSNRYVPVETGMPKTDMLAAGVDLIPLLGAVGR